MWNVQCVVCYVIRWWGCGIRGMKRQKALKTRKAYHTAPRAFHTDRDGRRHTSPSRSTALSGSILTSLPIHPRCSLGLVILTHITVASAMISHPRPPMSHSLHPALQHPHQLPTSTNTKHTLLITVLLLPPSLAPRHTILALHPPPTLPTLRLVIVCQPSDTIATLLQSVGQHVREEDEGEGGWGEVRGLGVFREGYKVRGSYRVEDVFERGERVLVTASSSKVSETHERLAEDELSSATNGLQAAKVGEVVEQAREPRKQAHSDDNEAELQQPARKKSRTTPPIQPLNHRTSPAVQPLPPPPAAPTPAIPRNSAIMPPPSTIPSRPSPIPTSPQSAVAMRASVVVPAQRMSSAVMANVLNGAAAAQQGKKDKSHLPLDVETDEEEQEAEKKQEKERKVDDKKSRAEELVEQGKKARDSKAAAAARAKESGGRETQTGSRRETEKRANGLHKGGKPDVVEAEDDEQLPATQQLQPSSQDEDEDMPATQRLTQSSQQSNAVSDAHTKHDQKQQQDEDDWEDDKQHEDESSGLDDDSDEDDTKNDTQSKHVQQPINRSTSNLSVQQKQNKATKVRETTNATADAESSADEEEDDDEETQSEEKVEEEKSEVTVSPRKQPAITSPNKRTNGTPASAHPIPVSSEDESEIDTSEESEAESESEDESATEGKTPVLQPEVVPYGQFRHLQGGNKLADKINAPLPSLPPAAAVILPLSQPIKKLNVQPALSKPAASDKDSSDSESEKSDNEDSDNDDNSSAATNQSASHKLSLPARSVSHTPKRTGNAALAGMFDEEAQLSASQPASRQLPSSRQSVGGATPVVRKKEPPSPYEVLGRAQQQNRRATVGEVQSGSRAVEERKEPAPSASVNGAAARGVKKRGQGERGTEGAQDKQKENRTVDDEAEGDDEEPAPTAAAASVEEKSVSKPSKAQNTAKPQKDSESVKRTKAAKPAVVSATPSTPSLAASSRITSTPISAPLSPPSAGRNVSHQSSPSPTSSSPTAPTTAVTNGSGSRNNKASGQPPQVKKGKSAAATTTTTTQPPPSPPLTQSQQSTDSYSSASSTTQLTAEEKEKRKLQRARERARERYAKLKAEREEKSKQAEGKKTANKKRKKEADSSENDSE